MRPGAEDATFERKDFTRDLAKKALTRVIALSIFLGFLHSLISDGDLTGSARGIVDMMVPPLAVASVLLTVSLLVNLLFRGYMVSPVSTSVMVLSVTSFMFILLDSLSALIGSDSLAVTSTFVLVAGATMAAYFPFKAWARHLGTIPSSVAAIFLAIVFYTLYSGLVPATLLAAASVTVAVAGALRLLSSLGRHGDPAVRRRGRFIGSGAFMAVAIALVLFAFFFFGWLWPETRHGDQHTASLVFWVAICIMLALCGLALVLYLRSKKLDTEFGTWGMKIDDIVGNDPELAEAAAAIREFVEEGRKERLVVKMTAILVSNGVSENACRDAVGDVIRYREPVVRMALATAFLDIEGEARAERERIVLAMLRSAARKIGAPHAVRGLPGKGL